MVYAPVFRQLRGADAVVVVIASSGSSSPTSTSITCAHNSGHSNASAPTLRAIHVRLLCTPPTSVSLPRAQPCIQWPPCASQIAVHLTVPKRAKARSDLTTSSTQCQRTHALRARSTGNPTHGCLHRRGRIPTLRAGGVKGSAQAARCEGLHLRRSLINRLRTFTEKLFLGT